MDIDEARKRQTQAARDARSRKVAERRQREAAELLRAAGWTCQPPDEQKSA